MTKERAHKNANRRRKNFVIETNLVAEPAWCLAFRVHALASRGRVET